MPSDKLFQLSLWKQHKSSDQQNISYLSSINYRKSQFGTEQSFINLGFHANNKKNFFGLRKDIKFICTILNKKLQWNDNEWTLRHETLYGNRGMDASSIIN